MSDRPPARRPITRLGRVLLLATACLSLGAAACGSEGSGDATGGEPTSTERTSSSTTTTAAPTTSTTVPPTTAPTDPPSPPSVDPTAGRAEATAAALKFLSASETAEVRRLCDSAQLNVHVEHPGATMTVGIVGDSLTVQTLDQITADPRFNWSVSAMCGARGDHYAGHELLGGALGLRGAYDEVLRSDPDILLIALGTNDVLEEVYTNVPRDLSVGIEALLRAADAVPCVSWVNVHTPVRPGQPYGPEYRWDHYASHYNQTIDAYVGAGWTGLANWDAVVRSSSPDQLLMSDGIHLSPGGRDARTGLVHQTVTDLAATCVPPPDPVEPPADPGTTSPG